MQGREDTPWYPTMRLFRQTKLSRWDDVFQRITEEIKRRVGRRGTQQAIPVEVSPGELLDKITILQIKAERMTDATKLHNVRVELAALTSAAEESLPPSEEVSALSNDLKAVNEVIWDVEDALRSREREQRFDAEFVELARSVYRNNDTRAIIKRRINEIYSSHYVEEKEHPEY